jgi:hypothetical protein
VLLSTKFHQRLKPLVGKTINQTNAKAIANIRVEFKETLAVEDGLRSQERRWIPGAVMDPREGDGSQDGGSQAVLYLC